MAPSTTVATLPTGLRSELKEPLGPVFADAERLLSGAGRPLVAVGDVVTYHLLAVGVRPDVAVIDGRSEREAIDEEIASALSGLAVDRRVENDPATLSAELVAALAAAIRNADGDATTVLAVDGEEDLATLPAVLIAPDGATVVYGQPGEGMVRTPVEPGTRTVVRNLLERFETDERFWELLD